MKRIVFDRAALHSSASLAAPFAVPNHFLIRWCFLGLFGASGGEPGPPATSFRPQSGSGPKKKRSFLLLLRIPADLKGGRRRAVEERADLLRTGGRALQGRAASERERERERERLLGVGFGNDDAPGQVSPFHRTFFFWVLVGSGATTTTTPPPSPLFVSSWEFTRR